MKKETIYVSAIYISPPDTMGGNSKILLELINQLSDEYNFIVFTSEPVTFKKNIKKISKIKLIDVNDSYKKMSFKTHFAEIKYVDRFFNKYFSNHKITPNDWFYSCSDFAPDVIPVSNLKKKFQFKWIASLYLFIPNPVENLINGYKFPFFKYLIYFIYQRWLFLKIKQDFDYCLITNEVDKKYFSKDKHTRLISMYGGVNIEQIIKAKKHYSLKYEAVFCSRLHPQKGISQLLSTWHEVVQTNPSAKLAIIGNGEPKYEKFLRAKMQKLALEEKNIDWLGYVNNVDKYKIYFQSKMLLHGTIYDNNGMVAAEALCAGLPVVMYDLVNLRKVYTKGCIKARYGDQSDYTKKVARLISDLKYYKKIAPSAKDIKEIQKIWSWEQRALMFKKFLING